MASPLGKEASRTLTATAAADASWLRLVGASALVLAVLNGAGVVEISNTTLYLLLISAVAITFPSVGKLTFNKDGFSFERAVEQLQKGIETLDARTTDLGMAVSGGIGGKGANNGPPASVPATRLNATARLAERRADAAVDQQAIDDSDPQLGQWGGKAEDNGRRLNATVRQSALGGYFVVTLWVESTDRKRPLTDPVTFHLHSTFQSPQTRPAQNGRATLELLAWGDFTVGALTDGGATKLELNLASIEAPEGFHVP